MPSMIGNVGLWANYFIRPEDLPPTARRPTAHRGHRGLFARARDPFASPNTHSLFYAAQLPPDWVIVTPYTYQRPGSALRAAVEEVFFGISRPFTSAYRAARLLGRGLRGLARVAARTAARAGRALLRAAAGVLQVLLLAVVAVYLTMSAVFYIVASPAQALRELCCIVLELRRSSFLFYLFGYTCYVSLRGD